MKEFYPVKKNLWARSLMDHFRLGIKHVIAPRLGVEVEHFIVHHDTKAAVSYDVMRDILRGLMLYYPGAEALGEEDLLGFSTEHDTYDSKVSHPNVAIFHV